MIPDVFCQAGKIVASAGTMPRRQTPGGYVFHVMNRGVRRMSLFEEAGDYRAFLRCVAETQGYCPMRVLAYCVMPNHFHLVCWPEQSGQLSLFMKRLTGTHSKRWHALFGSKGTGAVYQGRYRLSAVKTDHHLLNVCRYVERTPLRAGLVSRAQDWPWSSLGQDCKNCDPVALTDWPVARPGNWEAIVNAGESASETEALRRSIRRCQPIGDARWRVAAAQHLGLKRLVG